MKNKDNLEHVDGAYAKYVLFVLVLVYMFNIVDRHIFSILAEDIKSDLLLSDADIGFLGGAAFAVFYAIFGLPLARLADVWNRTRLIGIGLGFWSLMTALSGLAQGMLSLSACRFAVGIGEASSTPSSYSILYDYFSPKVRATVVGFFSCGVYFGAGLGLFFGGVLLDYWNTSFADVTTSPFGLKGWQAVFIIVGLPGVLMGFWVLTLKEPKRGISDGISSPVSTKPFKDALIVLFSVLPLINLVGVLRAGGRWSSVLTNLVTAGAISLVVLMLANLTGSSYQWAVLGYGVYALASWMQTLAHYDRVAFGMIFRCKSLLFSILAMVSANFTSLAVTLWAVPYFLRYYGVSSTDVGTYLGFGYILFGLPGAVFGGYLSDKWRQKSPRGKLYVLMISISLSAMSAFYFLSSSNLIHAYAGIYLMYFAGAMGFGSGGSTINDLVLPRARATVVAFNGVAITLFAAAAAPYVVGQVADYFVSLGENSGEALRISLLWSLPSSVLGICFLLIAILNLESDELSVSQRARILGEDI